MEHHNILIIKTQCALPPPLSYLLPVVIFIISMLRLKHTNREDEKKEGEGLNETSIIEIKIGKAYRFNDHF